MSHEAVAIEPSMADVMEELGYPAGASFLDMLRHMASGDRARLAVQFHDENVTYGELLDMVAGGEAFLRSHGVERGDRVAYMVTAHPNALATYLAIIGGGSILVPVYAEIDGEVLRGTLARYEVSTIIVDPELRPKVDAIAGGVPTLERVWNVRDSEYADALEAGGDIGPLLQRTTPSAVDPAMILSTSGTTGTPKGVVQFGSFSLGSLTVVRKWGIDVPPIKAYICTSWGHGTIQFMSTLAFWTGGSVVLAERFSASRFFEDVHRYGVTYIHPIGTMQRMLFNQRPGPYDRDHDVRLCISPGMPRDIWAAFEERFGVRAIEIYSATDGGGLWLTNDGRYPVGSVGRPWMETEARIVDDDRNEVPVGEVGELQLRPRGRPPVVHYYNDPVASAEKVRDGWISMGDYFKVDESGNYWFLDRKRDVIRRRGINLAPASIEEAIVKHDKVSDVCAIAVPSELGEDEIKAVVVSTDPSVTPADIVEFAAAGLPQHMRPKYVEIVDELPTTTGTARVQRFKLREGWRNETTWDADTASYLRTS
jgi:crotonobetaine/carnitine-CoA ligase